MKTKAQIAMETAIIMLLILVIFLSISLPLSKLNVSSAKDSSNAALAYHYTQALALAVDEVGSSGFGARKRLELRTPEGLTDMSCVNNRIDMKIELYNANITNSSKGWTTIRYRQEPENKTVSAFTAFDMIGDCQKVAGYTKATFCLNNTKGEVYVDFDCDNII